MAKGKTKAPPKKNPAAELAQKLLDVLQSQRLAGAPVYPLTLDRAAEQADPQADLKTILSAVGRKEFKAVAIVAKAKSARFTAEQAVRVPVALLEDVDQLAAAPATLELALRVKWNKKVHAFDVTALAAAVSTKLRPAFKAVWNRRVEAGELPSGVGFIRIRTPKLFRLDDLQPESLRKNVAAGRDEPMARRVEPQPLVASAPPTTEAPFDFPARFDEAFRQIDYRKGGHNFVSLVELRQSLASLPRGVFDAGLRQLRLAGRYTLSAAESVQGIRPEERAAGIEEAGSLLLYASRKGGSS